MEKLDKATRRSILRHCSKEERRLCKAMNAMIAKVDAIHWELAKVQELQERV